MSINRFFTLFVVLLWGLAVNAQDKKELVILHTNDTHSTIDPTKATVADTLIAGRGGVVRRAYLIDEERQKNPDLLLFDSGDFSQGSPYYTMFKGVVEIGVMNAMGYDATTLGNHEFDNGMENLAKLIRMAKFPFVCSNYDFTGSPLEGLVKPWITLKRNGIKIGVLGLSPVLSGIVMEGAINGIKYIDPIRATQETSDYLKNVEKCDLVICLIPPGYSGEIYCDPELVEQTRNVDLVIGGHSHTFLKTEKLFKNLDGEEVPVVQDGCWGINVGEIRVR